jgi:hypothetical protein
VIPASAIMKAMNKRIVLLGCAPHPGWIQGFFRKRYEESRKDK